VSDSDLLEEQIAYYRARAAEYDATSTPDGDPFAAAADCIRVALRSSELRGRILELAAGTGQWTGLLANEADELTATDASGEMLALNAAKVKDSSIRYRAADVFRLEPTHDHDVVFFGFWLSHVPLSLFEAFWRVVEGLLAPRGRAVFVDEAAHGLWDEDWLDEKGGIVRRTLSDGRAHRAVKVLWRPHDLQARLIGLGWDTSVHAEGPFYWGTALVPQARLRRPELGGRGEPRS
jgi:SAM-dependent methyltransferase